MKQKEKKMRKNKNFTDMEPVIDFEGLEDITIRIRKKYRIELTSDEMIFLRMQLDSNPNTPKELIDKLWNAKPYITSYSKRFATKKATESRVKKAKEKIQNAINLLQLENKAITHYSIAQASGVSYNTVKKHIPELDIIGKLE